MTADNGTAPPTALDRIAARRIHAAVLVVVACIVFFLPGFFTIPPVDRDESRFAQATRQMVQSGDYVDIRFQDRARHKKPVGIYWLQSAVVAIAGSGDDLPIWIYRLPSLTGATLAALATLLIGGLLFGPTVGLVSGLLMASVILLGVEARLAKTDAMLLATILGAQYVLARLWLGMRPRRMLVLAFYTAFAAGILIKGPVIVLVAGTTALALVVVRRSLAWLRPLADVPGILLFLALVLPWYIAIGIRTDGAFFSTSLGTDMFGKVASGKESHGAPPGTYLVATLATFWPASALLPVAAKAVRGALDNASVRFCLAWIVPTWLIFEAIPTKLPHYVLPVYPSLAILVAWAFMTAGPVVIAGRIARWWAVLLFVMPAAVAIAIGVLSYALSSSIDVAAILIAIGACVFGFWTWRLLRAGADRDRILAGMIVTAAAIYVAALGVTAPRLHDLWISGRLAQQIRQFNQCADPKIVSVGFSEPSLVLLSPRPIAFTGPAQLDDGNAASCRLMLVEERWRQAVLAKLAETGHEATEIGRERGRNLNGGRKLDIRVFMVVHNN